MLTLQEFSGMPLLKLRRANDTDIQTSLDIDVYQSARFRTGKAKKAKGQDMPAPVSCLGFAYV